MASWQAHLTVLFLKYQVKRKMRGDVDVVKARATLNGVKQRVPTGARAADDRVGGVPGEWMRPASGRAAGTLLYLHGGGYFACSPQTHRPITGGFARRGFNVFAPDYRLAPENPFPAGLDDAVAAYRGLLEQGVSPGALTLAGDSAGGGLALALLFRLREAGEPLPAAAVLFSPWTDLACTGETLRTNSARDAMFSGEGMERATLPYLAGADPRNPQASPLYGDLAGLPPLLIHASDYEVLLDDSRRLAERARAAGTPVTMRTWPVVPHAWQIFPIPEAGQSMDEAAEFLRTALKSAPERAAAAVI